MTSLDIDPKILGRRIAGARSSRGMTPDVVASFLGCSRPTYIAIEKGTQEIKADELIRLASLFGRKVHELARPGEPVVDLEPHLRAAIDRHQGDEARAEGIDRAIDQFQSHAEDYRELERMMDAPLRANLPPEIALNPRIDPVEQAEVAADRERMRLGLGDRPILNLREILEWDVGLRIFFNGDLPSRVAGMYAYSSGLGACILVNRKHPPDRCRVTMLHEYGHHLLASDRYRPGIDYLATPGRKPANERFAEAFALAFLMPATSIRQDVHRTLEDSGDFQVAALCRMKHHYFVSLQAMTLRVEGLGLVPKGTWDLLVKSRFAPRKVDALLGLASHPVEHGVVPERYKMLAVLAYQRGDLGDADLAYYLRTDVIEAREIAERTSLSREIDPAGVERSMQLDLNRSLMGEDR